MSHGFYDYVRVYPFYFQNSGTVKQYITLLHVACSSSSLMNLILFLSLDCFQKPPYGIIHSTYVVSITYDAQRWVSFLRMKPLAQWYLLPLYSHVAFP